jgi:hypothetical protein
MRKIFSNGAKLITLCLPVLMLLTLIAINSCRKNTTSSSDLNNQEISLAKKWYENTYPAGSSKGMVMANSIEKNTIPDMSQIITPDWGEADGYTRLGKNVIEIPMDGSVNWQTDLQVGGASLSNHQQNYSRTSFLIVGDPGKYRLHYDHCCRFIVFTK